MRNTADHYRRRPVFQEVCERVGITIKLTDRLIKYTIIGNADLLRQVFMNLFDNGIKYGEKHSDVTAEPWVQKSTGELLIRVSRRSVGILPGEETELFEAGY